jgi:hypothetical protein
MNGSGRSGAFAGVVGLANGLSYPASADALRNRGGYRDGLSVPGVTIDDLVLSFSEAMLVCVIFAGPSARAALADMDQFDAPMGLPPVPAESSDQNASAAKPLATLTVRQ